MLSTTFFTKEEVTRDYYTAKAFLGGTLTERCEAATKSGSSILVCTAALDEQTRAGAYADLRKIAFQSKAHQNPRLAEGLALVPADLKASFYEGLVPLGEIDMMVSELVRKRASDLEGRRNTIQTELRRALHFKCFENEGKEDQPVDGRLEQPRFFVIIGTGETQAFRGLNAAVDWGREQAAAMQCGYAVFPVDLGKISHGYPFIG